MFECVFVCVPHAFNVVIRVNVSERFLEPLSIQILCIKHWEWERAWMCVGILKFFLRAQQHNFVRGIWSLIFIFDIAFEMYSKHITPFLAIHSRCSEVCVRVLSTIHSAASIKCTIYINVKHHSIANCINTALNIWRNLHI